MGGLMLGLGIARFRDLSDRVFRSSAQVEASLQMDCLAILPNIKRAEIKQQSARRGASDASSARPVAPLRGAAGENRANEDSRTTTRTADDLLWYVVDKPFSPFAEAVRSIKMAADLNGANKSNKVIGITSALPHEGKSTVAGSLAQLIAHTGARTIL